MRATIQGLEVPAIEKPLNWQKMGLQFTASGYGSRVPTAYMVEVNGKWRRVYCKIYSNIGTLYIGKNIQSGCIVDLER
jgi:hypothetical protein